MNSPKRSGAFKQELQRVGALVAQRDDANAVPTEAGEFLHALVTAGRFQHALELGTGLGYSGLWIASALQATGGTLLTIDANGEKSDASRAAFERAGVGEIISMRVGRIAEILTTLNGAFDFVFIDADKDNMLEYWRLLQPLLQPNATIVTDNVNTHPRQLAEYLSHVRSLPEFYSTPLAIGNGMELTVRQSGGARS